MGNLAVQMEEFSLYQPTTKKDSSKCNGYKIIMMMMKDSGCVVSINFLETKSHSYHAFLSLVFQILPYFLGACQGTPLL